ncbi:hypothetical protein [Burkholderia oklahomensis]|uniref:hypothetical protein n=1 Tax=Burkholderia oklahomensis TaxID=342113 RepID=UPI000F544AE8|nr:hypothetical protein [Burkholderia oklahomensis]
MNPYLTGRRYVRRRIGGRLTLDCVRRISSSPGKDAIVRIKPNIGRRHDPKWTNSSQIRHASDSVYRNNPSITLTKDAERFDCFPRGNDRRHSLTASGRFTANDRRDFMGQPIMLWRH